MNQEIKAALNKQMLLTALQDTYPKDTQRTIIVQEQDRQLFFMVHFFCTNIRKLI